MSTDPSARAAPVLPPRRRDRAVIDAWPDVVAVHAYTAHWFSNATFVFPALAFAGTLIGWGISGSTELLGTSIFFAVVTLAMLPLVYLTWRRTPTAIVLRRDAIDALHQGWMLRSLPWAEVTAIRRAETMGNVRWYVVGKDGEHLTLEGEIDRLPALLAEARRLAGLPDETAPLRG